MAMLSSGAKGCERGSGSRQRPKRVRGVSELADEHLRVAVLQ